MAFEVSTTMLRSSRPIVGNTQRLHSFIRKLSAGKCTTVLIMGGSVSGGHNVKGGPKNAYPQIFSEWLNERYPCEGGSHTYKKTHASNSPTHFSAWSMIESIPVFDLVLLEFNVNDHYVGGEIPHALEDKGEIGEQYVSMFYFEVIIRRLLTMRTPDAPAIVTFNADYIGRAWAPPPYFDLTTGRKTLFRFNQEPMKLWLSNLYEIPVISVAIWHLVLASKLGINIQFPSKDKIKNNTYPYSTSSWHADRCCHPKTGGHLVLGLVLAWCLIDEERRMGTEKFEIEHDYTTDDNPVLRDPIYLSEEEDDLYVKGSAVIFSGLDFSDGAVGEDSWKDSVKLNVGWSHLADNKEKDKFGLIAEDSGHLVLELQGGKHGVVDVQYLVSYRDFGVALAWISDTLDGPVDTKYLEKYCNEPLNNLGGAVGSKMRELTRLVGIWDESASVPKSTLLETKLKEGKSSLLHICLLPPSDKLQGDKNKFKLLGVRVY